MSFTSRGSARFNWHSCAVASLKVPAMIIYDMVMNVLDTKWFPQHNIAGLISGIAFIVLFQSGEASTVEGNTHTHTHTPTQPWQHYSLCGCMVNKFIEIQSNLRRKKLHRTMYLSFSHIEQECQDSLIQEKIHNQQNLNKGTEYL